MDTIVVDDAPALNRSEKADVAVVGSGIQGTRQGGGRSYAETTMEQVEEDAPGEISSLDELKDRRVS